MKDELTGVFASARSYLNSLFGLARLEVSGLTSYTAERTRSMLVASLLFLLATAWASVAAAKGLSRWISYESISVGFAALFALLAIWVLRRSRAHSHRAFTETRRAIDGFASKVFTDSDRAHFAPFGSLSEEERSAAVGVSRDAVETARAELQYATFELKEAAGRSLNPLGALQDFIAKRPTAVVAGGLALGVIVGLNSSRRPRAHSTGG